MNSFEKIKAGISGVLATAVVTGGLSGDVNQVEAKKETKIEPVRIEVLAQTDDDKVAEIEVLDDQNLNVIINPKSDSDDYDGHIPYEVFLSQKEQQDKENIDSHLPFEVLEEKKRVEEEERKKEEEKQRLPCVVIYSGDTSKNEIAFTFDDQGENFDKILATLKENGINGTFFLLASEIRNNPERWQQAVKDGNLICSHGTSHNFSLGNQSEEAIRADIQEWEDAVTEVLGADYLKKFKEETPYFRTPGGNKTDTLLKVLGEMGYKYTFYWTAEDCWSMMPENNPNNLTMEQIYISSTKPGAIFLLHPPHQSHVDEIIDGVEAKGYTFVTLGEWSDYYGDQVAS